MKCLHDWEQQRLEYKNSRPLAIWFQRSRKVPTMTANVCLVNNKYDFEIFDTRSASLFVPLIKGARPTLLQAIKSVLKYFRD